MSKVIVVYGGGFQPFHRGHLSSYIEAKQAFPHADMYVAASNDIKVRPIPFEDKKWLAQQAGIQDPFIQVKAPIAPKEILSDYDPEHDIFILVRSERDPMKYTKADGSPGYFQPFVSLEDCEPFGKHGYVFVTHKHEFKLNGEPVFSGSQVRDMYSAAADEEKANIISQLYPRSQHKEEIKSKLDQYLSAKTSEEEPELRPDITKIKKKLKDGALKENVVGLIRAARPLLKEATLEQKIKFLRLIKESVAKDISPDYLPER
jgi:hypothetical protein